MRVADPDGVRNTARWMGQNLDLVHGLHDTGTAGGLRNLSIGGGLPTWNFQAGHFSGDDKINGEVMRDTILIKRATCAACAVRCKRVVQVDEPYRVDPQYGGPEYESLAALGSNTGVDDLLALAKASELCAAYGLDTISTGATIAFAIECFENGLLTQADAGGLALKWGDGGLIVHLVEQIAHRDGFGDLLAEGVARMARQIGQGAEAFALHVKGQELPMHEPRVKHAMGVGYAVAPVGADHMTNIHDTAFSAEGGPLRRVNAALDEPVAPPSPRVLDEDKMQIFYTELNWTHFQDCALNCMFYAYDYHHMAEALSGVSGVEYDIHDILAVGARAQTLARLFNLREGFTADDDKLPKRVMKAFKSGPVAGVEITPEDFAWAKRRYYELMKWDPESGAPSDACIRELKLDGLLADAKLQS